MLLKATHDSITGEKPSGLLSWLLLPFSRTQSKTLMKQYIVGVRYFDVRVRKNLIFRNKWVFAHGLFTVKARPEDILYDLNIAAIRDNDHVYMNLTYEGWGDKEFLAWAKSIEEKYTRIKVCFINQKYSEGLKLKWKTLHVYGENCQKSQDYFAKLDFRDWRTFLPLPWFYKKFGKYKHVEFNSDYFKFVDFI